MVILWLDAVSSHDVQLRLRVCRRKQGMCPCLFCCSCVLQSMSGDHWAQLAGTLHAALNHGRDSAAAEDWQLRIWPDGSQVLLRCLRQHDLTTGCMVTLLA